MAARADGVPRNIKVPSMRLWKHQQEAIDLCRGQLRDEGSRVLVQLPPGAGKTEVGALCAIDWLKGGPFRKVLIAVPTAPILRQYHKRLVHLTTIQISVEKASRVVQGRPRLTIASQASLWNRIERYSTDTLFIIDECHHSNYDAPENLRLVQRFARVVGLSASPWSQGCSDLFGHSDSYFMSLREAQEAHLAAPYEVKAWEPERGPWALVFCTTNNECAERSAARSGSSWIGVNVSAALVSQRIRAWQGRRLDILYVNRMLLEGFDEKRCSNVWIAKDCESQIMIVQMVGRALRYVSGKCAEVYCTSPQMIERVQAALDRLNARTF